MLFAILVHEDEQALDALSDEEIGARARAYLAFRAELDRAGAFRAGHGLWPTSLAVATIRTRGAEVEVVRSPPRPAGEQLTGLYLIEADGLEDAIAVARGHPAVRDGSVEVRVAI